MASSHSIATFDENQDRTRFGDWLSGFTDGEGSFVLTWGNKDRQNPTAFARFLILLRRDDEETLRKIQSFFQCGTIGHIGIDSRQGMPNSKPACQFRVSNIDHLRNIVVPHFEQYPLRAKKARDFEIWKKGVELFHTVMQRPSHSLGTVGGIARWSEQERAEFSYLIESLRNNRQYEFAPLPPLVLPKMRDLRDSPLFSGLPLMD